MQPATAALVEPAGSIGQCWATGLPGQRTTAAPTPSENRGLHEIIGIRGNLSQCAQTAAAKTGVYLQALLLLGVSHCS